MMNPTETNKLKITHVLITRCIISFSKTILRFIAEWMIHQIRIPALLFISNSLPRLRENLFVTFLESRRNEFLQFRFKIK